MNDPSLVDAVDIKVLVGRAGFDEIRMAWQRLAEQSGNHFLHYPGWYEAELANVERDDGIYFVTVEKSDGELLAVLPLQRAVLKKGTLKLPILEIFYANEMGVNDITSCVDLSPYREKIIHALHQSTGYFAFIRWQCILQCGHASQKLGLAQEMRLTHQSKFIDFSQGLESFWATYNSRFRRALRKKVGKAEEKGTLSLMCAADGQALQNAFATFLEVEDSGWKGERGTSIRQQPKQLAYYQSLLHSYSQTQQVHINILYLNDVAIAGQYGICVGDRLYLLKIGFSEAFAELRPGYLILVKLIEEMAQANVIKSISFVTGVDWIDRWHPKADEVGIAYSDNGTFYSKVLLRAMTWYIKRRETKRAVSSDSSVTDDSD